MADNPFVVHVPTRKVINNGLELKFFTPNQEVITQVNSYFSREPETLSWIWGIPDNGVFYDVGANIGLYTILSGRRSIQTFAFEPEAQNYALLYTNIALNRCDAHVRAFCAALSDQHSIRSIHLNGMTAGGCNHWVEGKGGPSPDAPKFHYVQGCITMSVDDLVYGDMLPAPSHMKIDVDGHEADILRGMDRYLNDARLRSVLMEIDTRQAGWEAIVARFVRSGFTFSEEETAARLHRSHGVANYIFDRPDR